MSAATRTLARNMAAFQAKYTPDQREAIASAVIDRGASAPRVVELAAAGQLTDTNGTALAPFTVPANTVRSEARKAKKRRQGKAVSELAQAEPRDAVEALRRRLINLGDAMLAAEEKRKPETVDPARAREIARYVREAAALPGPKDARPHKPGTRVNGKQEEGQTRTRIARDLLDAHRVGDGRAKPRNGTPTSQEQRDTGAPQAQQQDEDEAQETEDDASPGSSGSSGRGHATPPLVPAA